jgi:hypothetical protein
LAWLHYSWEYPAVLGSLTQRRFSNRAAEATNEKTN